MLQILVLALFISTHFDILKKKCIKDRQRQILNNNNTSYYVESDLRISGLPPTHLPIFVLGHVLFRFSLPITILYGYFFLTTGTTVLSLTCPRVTCWSTPAEWLTTTRAWQQPKALGTFSSPLSPLTASNTATNATAYLNAMKGSQQHRDTGKTILTMINNMTKNTKLWVTWQSLRRTEECHSTGIIIAVSLLVSCGIVIHLLFLSSILG